MSGPIITGDSNQVTQASGPDEVATAFARIQTALATTQLPANQKVVAETAVNSLQEEAKKGEQAEEQTVQSWLTTLLQMSPDIGEVAIQTF